MNVQSTMEDPAGKKKAIFESTFSLIRDHGFHGASMSMVAKKAGVAAGTIYHYFESKDQLICELYQYNLERVMTVVRAAVGLEIPYREKFLKIWTDLYGFYVQEPNVLIFFEQFLNSPFNADKTPSQFRGLLFSFFSSGIKSGHIKAIKAEILLVLFIGSVTSTAKLHVFGNVPLGRADINRIVELLWDGISHGKQGASRPVRSE